MKQGIALLLAVLLTMAFACAAFADATPANFEEQAATVSNPDGAVLYNGELEPGGAILPAGTALRVDGEFRYGDALFYSVYDSALTLTGYVRAEDLTFRLTQISPQEENRYPAPVVRTVINPDGVELREGPGEMYPTVGVHLPFGTEVTFTHADGDPAYESLINWSYTEWNGVGGWAKTLQRLDEGFQFATPVGAEQKHDQLIPTGALVTLEALPLYRVMNAAVVDGNADAAENVLATVPAQTELTCTLYYGNNVGIYAYTSYQGMDGWIELIESDIYVFTSKAGYAVDNYLMTKESSGLPTYRTARDASSRTDVVLPAWRVLHYDFFLILNPTPDAEECWYRVEVDGAPLWIKTNGWLEAQVFTGTTAYEVIAEAGLACYDAPEASAAPVAAVPQGARLEIEFQIARSEADGSVIEWYYGLAQGRLGWFRDLWVTSEDAESSAGANIRQLEEHGTLLLQGKALASDAGITPRSMIFLCAGAAVVLAAAAALILLRIKKKKQKTQ